LSTHTAAVACSAFFEYSNGATIGASGGSGGGVGRAAKRESELHPEI